MGIKVRNFLNKTTTTTTRKGKPVKKLFFRSKQASKAEMVLASMASGWPYDPGILKKRQQPLKKTREYSSSFFRLELSAVLAREPRARRLLKKEVI